MKYGCHNHPPRVDSYVTGRAINDDGVTRIYRVKNTASKECKYDLNHRDPKCKDCVHAPQPESVP